MSQPEHPWVLLTSVNRNTSQAWPGKFMLQRDVDSFEKLPRPKLPAQAVARVRELTRETQETDRVRGLVALRPRAETDGVLSH